MAEYKIGITVELNGELTEEELDTLPKKFEAFAISEIGINGDSSAQAYIKHNVTFEEESKRESPNIIDISPGDIEYREKLADAILNLPTTATDQVLIRYGNSREILLDNANNIFTRIHDTIDKYKLNTIGVSNGTLIGIVFNLCSYIADEWNDYKHRISYFDEDPTNFINYDESEELESHRCCKTLVLKKSDEIVIPIEFNTILTVNFGLAITDSYISKIIDVIKETGITFNRYEDECHKNIYSIK